MQIAHFTERPMRYIPEAPVLQNRAFFGVSNKYFDAENPPTTITSTSTKPSIAKRWASMRSR